MSAQPYEGGCHCGAVRYRVTADLTQAIVCNCSHCQAKGFILAFAPPDQFELLRGEDAQTEYLFNKHVIRHLFCKTCGMQSFARGQTPDGKAMIAVNARALDGVEPGALSPMPVDGRRL
ncbi:MAG: GFA family protein [Hyphomonadaceae bacterium]